MRNRFTLSAILAVGCLTLIGAGCTRDPAVAKQRHLEKAKAYYAKNQYNEAIIELKNAEQIDPKFAPAVHLMGQAYAAKAWHLDAMRELRRAVELAPDDLETHVDLGRTYVTIEAWDDALREAATIEGKDPANPWGPYFRAAALNAKGQRQEALTAIEKALAVGQSPPAFQNVHGNILSGLERYGEAEVAYRAALAQNPKYTPARVGLGDLLRIQNRPDEARRVLTEAKTDDPLAASVHLALSNLDVSRGKLDDALKELDSLPRQNWTPRVALTAGQLDVQTGHFQEAVALLTGVKQLFPDVVAARYWLGHAFLGLSRPDEALTEFRVAAQKAPDNLLVHFAVAQALLETKQPREALADLDRLAKPMAKVPDYHLLVGRVHLALGNADEAIKDARMALTLAPQNARAYGLIGSAYAAKGDLRGAQDAYAKAVEVDPGFTAGRVALGNVYNLEKKPEDALKEYDAVLAQDPRNQPAVVAKVTALVEQKRLDEAITTAQTAAKADAKSAAPHELLGRLYALKNDGRSAEMEFNEALRLDDAFVPARLGLARLAVANHKSVDAASQLRRVLKDQPSNLPAALMLSELHAREFRYDQAIPVLESAAGRSADPAATLALANLYIRSGRFDDAIARLAPLVKDNPNFVQARFLTGVAQLGKGNATAAIAEFEAVNRLNPQLGLSHYYLGRALRARGDVAGAKREYQLAAQLLPNSLQIKIEMAGLSGEAPDPALLSAWIEQLKASVAKDPGDIGLREELGKAYLTKNQLAEAETEFKRVLEAAPLSPTANRGMGLIRFAQKKPDDAVPYLQTVLRVDPSDIQANLILASYYSGKGNPDRAVEHLEAVQRANPTLPGLKLQLAQAYGNAGRLADGVARAKEAVASDPKSAVAHQLLGMLYLKQGQLDLALNTLNTATQLEPKSAVAYFALGDTYQGKGDNTNAVAAYRRVIDLSPKDPRPYNNIAYIYASEGKNLDEALTLAQKSQSLAPDSGGVLDTLGYVYYRRGEYQKAEPILKQATGLLPKEASAFYHLGMTYYKLGRRDDAQSAFRRSLQLKDTGPEAAEIRTVLEALKK